MFTRQAVTVLNHLLSGETWGRDRLRRFAGQHARLAGGPLKLDLAVDGDGYFQAIEGAGELAPAVTIELPADAAFRFLTDRHSVFTAARISGTADFAEALAFVFRNLRWDVEEDLSKVVGDILARRIVRTGKAFVAWQRKAGSNLAANAVEYLSEESELAIPKREMAQFRSELEAVREELVRLEGRIGRLA